MNDLNETQRTLATLSMLASNLLLAHADLVQAQQQVRAGFLGNAGAQRDRVKHLTDAVKLLAGKL